MPAAHVDQTEVHPQRHAQQQPQQAQQQQQQQAAVAAERAVPPRMQVVTSRQQMTSSTSSTAAGPVSGGPLTAVFCIVAMLLFVIMFCVSVSVLYCLVTNIRSPHVHSCLTVLD